MKVLQSNIVSLKLLGIIEPNEKDNHKKILVSQYTCYISPILLLLPSIAFFLTNIDDVAQATGAFYLICIVGMALLRYFDCLLKKSSMQRIIVHLQRIVDSTTSEFEHFYAVAEKHTNQIVKFFDVFVFSSVYGVVSLPCIILLALFLTGNYSNDVRMLPASIL